jgi:DNA primase
MQAHIIMQGTSILYSPFEDRIIFPIKDHLGRFCAFGGRIFKPHDTRPKYYNSKENEFFTKGSILFGLDTAKKSIQERKTAFLVEGYTDCIVMVQHQYPNTVATLGTACTEQHLKLLSRYADYLYILYDSDAAGEQAILRLTKLCWQANMELRVIHLPTGQDPASFLSAGNSLESRIGQAQDIFNFFIASLSKEFTLGPLHEKVGKIRSLIETIQAIEDPLKQDILLQDAARTFDIPLESFRRELQHRAATRPQTDKLSPVDPDDQEGPPEPSSLEKRIFCAIINNVNLLKSPLETYVIEYISSPVKEILHSLQNKTLDDSSFEFSDFFDTLSEQEKQYVSQLLLEHEELNGSVSYEYLVQQFQKKQWKRIVRDITSKLTLAQQQGDLDKVQRILDDFHALKEKIIPRSR